MQRALPAKNLLRFCDAGRGGFTLIELLVVMVIIGILAVATLPAIRGTLDGLNITGAADIAAAEFQLARQTAISRNLPVEVRIYKIEDEIDTSSSAYRLIAPVISTNASGAVSDEWLASLKVLPGGVRVVDTGDFSSVVSKAVAKVGDNPPGPWTSVEQTSAPAPTLVRGKEYVAFVFRPDGSVNLPGDEAWNIALRGPHAEANGTEPAANYVSLVFDALTGRVLTFQP